MSLNVKHIFTLLVLFALTGCGDTVSQIPRPKGVLSEEKMIEVMTDMHLIEGGKVGRKIMGDTLLLDDYYYKLFDKYQTDKETFNKSYEFYAKQPELMNSLYEKVIENLNQLQKSVPKWNEETDTTPKLRDAMSLEKADSSSEVKTTAKDTLIK